LEKTSKIIKSNHQARIPGPWAY